MAPITYLLSSLSVAVATSTIKLTIPDAPPADTVVLDGAFQGYSMEVASFADIAGNLTSPNKLSNRMLQNLKDITGTPAHIRVGGTTANHASWVPEQKEAIIQNFATPGADQPANVTMGPLYLESFKTFPKGTQYTMGLTFDSGSDGEDATVKQATAFYQGIGGDLFAFEVGNEFDAFPVDRNITTWSLKEYVSEWLERTEAVARRVFAKNASPKLFQAGAFVAPGSVTNDTTWTAQNALDLGINSHGLARTWCTHQYFGAACRPIKPTMAGNLMNRTAMLGQMLYHQGAATYTTSKGLPYVIGETNSIACQGLAGVSDVFGAAVWAVDYALYAASIKVSGLYWHMGTGYRYAAWQAVQNGTTAPGPRPLYYGNLFIATALGGANKQVVSISNTTSVAGYAIYSAARPKKRATLESIVLVNMDIYNSSAIGTQTRPSTSFELPRDCLNKAASAKVRRMTAAGAEAKEGIAFGGRTVGLDGRISGKEVVERVKDGVVDVKASEAVLISFT